MSDRDNFGSFFSGFLIGGIAGAIAAFLLAPQSGEETRKQIREKAITYTDEILAQTEKAFDDVSKTASEVAEKGQVILESKKEKAPPKKKSAKSEEKK